MASCLIRTGSESVTLPDSVVQTLLAKGDGDAALLYLALLRHHGTVPPRSLAGELRWERERLERAESSLQELKLIAAAEPETPPAPADERPEYRADEVARKLEKNTEFSGLTAQVERYLGKKLTIADISVLLGLNDYLGLPADVIYLLVCHCTEKTEKRLGKGRRPGMRQIEKEGYAWARMGIDTQSAAAEYLKNYALRSEAVPLYMKALQLPERQPSPSEEKYLLSWQALGFGPDTVALACDKTILRCHELKWPYLNGILKRWHEAGLHTVEEIEAGDRPGGQKSAAPAAPDRSGTNMRKYVQALHRKERGE
ncbi:MAG: DnaD domain protein [Oscillibacter sp.]|nr:DnaD domain protein [Oscillibacter sp.]